MLMHLAKYIVDNIFVKRITIVNVDESYKIIIIFDKPIRMLIFRL